MRYRIGSLLAPWREGGPVVDLIDKPVPPRDTVKLSMLRRARREPHRGEYLQLELTRDDVKALVKALGRPKKSKAPA